MSAVRDDGATPEQPADKAKALECPGSGHQRMAHKWNWLHDTSNRVECVRCGAVEVRLK